MYVYVTQNDDITFLYFNNKKVLTIFYTRCIIYLQYFQSLFIGNDDIIK